MMKHKDIEKLIHKKLDRETTLDEEKHLHEHLNQCPECQTFYQELVQTGQSLGGLTEFFPRHGFNEQVLKIIGVKRARVWKKVVPVLTGAWVGSLLFLILSPLPKNVLGQLLTLTPSLMRLSDKINLIAVSFKQLLAPFIKYPVNLFYPLMILLISIFTFIIFSKIIEKEKKLVKSKI